MILHYRSKARVLLGLFCAALLSACSAPHEYKRLPADARVLAFGNSLTYGTGTSRDNAYPRVLEGLIKREVINGGVPGETTTQGLKRLPATLNQTNPQFVILCEGGNDMIRRHSQAQMKQNLRKMIALIRQHHAQVLLIAVPQPKLSLAPSPVYAELGKELNVLVQQSKLSQLLKHRKYKSDTIHLNKAGYRLWAKSIAALMRKHGAIR